jgi:hypothetical protein
VGTTGHAGIWDAARHHALEYIYIYWSIYYITSTSSIAGRAAFRSCNDPAPWIHELMMQYVVIIIRPSFVTITFYDAFDLIQKKETEKMHSTYSILTFKTSQQYLLLGLTAQRVGISRIRTYSWKATYASHIFEGNCIRVYQQLQKNSTPNATCNCKTHQIKPVRHQNLTWKTPNWGKTTRPS